MPIVELQRRMRELGRIRTGVQVPKKGGGKRPEKLETFRLTSDSESLIRAVAEAYGGVAKPWADAPDGPEWEVITTAETLDIVVPPGQSVTQWYEMWSGGGCQRRCDGQTEVLSMSPCKCPADPAERIELAGKGQACKATTRLNVILPRIPDLGVWRLESHGYYAAVELAGAAEVLAAASASGVLIPARLRLDQRTKKVPGKPTNRYAVPVIEFHDTKMADLIAEGSVRVAGQLASGPIERRPELPPGPPLPERSDFRAPAAAAADPDEIAGDAVEVDDDMSFAPPPPAPAAAPQVQTQAGPAPLSQRDFMVRLDETEGVTQALVVEAARRLFPGIANLAALSDEARGRLWATTLELVDERAKVTA